MTKKIYVLLALLTASFIFGCSTKWKDPETSMPAKKEKISRILITPTIFDGSALIVEGMVWDDMRDTKQTDEDSFPYTLFKLADKDGNYISVLSLGHLDIVEGDKVRVLGMFRINMETEHFDYDYVIEAKNVESID